MFFFLIIATNHWLRTTEWEPLVENHRLRTTGWEPLNENHWMRTTEWEPLVENHWYTRSSKSFVMNTFSPWKIDFKIILLKIHIGNSNMCITLKISFRLIQVKLNSRRWNETNFLNFIASFPKDVTLNIS